MQVDRLLVAHQPRLTLAGDEQAADLGGDGWQKVPASNECDGGSNCEETDEHYCHRGDGPANRSSCCDTQAEREQGVSDDLRTLNIECEPLAVGIVRNSRGPFLSRHGEDSGHHNRCRAENGQLDEEPFATGDPLGPDHLVGALLKLTSQQGRTDEHARQHRQHDKSQIERLPKHPESGVEGSERPPAGIVYNDRAQMPYLLEQRLCRHDEAADQASDDDNDQGGDQTLQAVLSPGEPDHPAFSITGAGKVAAAGSRRDASTISSSETSCTSQSGRTGWDPTFTSIADCRSECVAWMTVASPSITSESCLGAIRSLCSATNSSISPTTCTCPPFRITRWSHTLSSSATTWDDRITDKPSAATASTRAFMISRRAKGSRLDRGSSSSNRSGRLPSARARLTCACWPPDRWATLRFKPMSKRFNRATAAAWSQRGFRWRPSWRISPTVKPR